MHIDVPTLYVLGIGTLGVAAAMTLWECKAQPQRAEVLRLWAVGYAVLACGCIALLYRSLLPGVWGQTVVGVVVMSAYALLLRGAMRLAGPAPLSLPIAAVGVVAAMWLTLGAAYPEAVWNYVSSAPNALIHYAIAWSLWRNPVLSALRSRRLALGLFLFHALFWTLRCVLPPLFAAWLGPGVMALSSKITMVEGLLYSVAIPAALLALVREEAEHKLLAASRTDYLTGLRNRQAFFEIGESVLASETGPVTLLAFDLDHFKAINDRHGHAVGDEVLRRFGETARHIFGKDAILARIGGEEFAALLPGIDAHKARILANDLRGAVSGVSNRPADGIVTTTVSIGLAERDGRLRDLNQFLRIADQALYEAKSLGRNRVEVADVAAMLRPARAA